jgi:hypothetical protein
VPKNHQDTLKYEIERQVKLGVLKRCSDSEWAAPPFIIPKKNWTVRFISDFRKLNAQFRRKPYPIPRKSQMLQELEEFVFATFFDSNMGYCNIRLDRDAQKLCDPPHFDCKMTSKCNKYVFLTLSEVVIQPTFKL